MYSQAKALVAEVDYTPYGQAYTANDTIGITHRYTGHDWDATAALYFAPYRFYNPQLARWMSRDPLGMVDGPNVYGYVNGNAINKSDPLGLFGPLIIIGLAVAAVIGAWGVFCTAKATNFAQQARGDDAKMHCLAGCYFQRCRALAPSALVEGLVGEVVLELFPPYWGWREAVDDIIQNFKGQLMAYDLTKT